MNDLTVIDGMMICKDITNESGDWCQYKDGTSVFYAKGSCVWEYFELHFYGDGSLESIYGPKVITVVSLGKKGFIASSFGGKP